MKGRAIYMYIYIYTQAANWLLLSHENVMRGIFVSSIVRFVRHPWFGDIHRTRRLVAEFSKRRCRRSARGMSIKKIRWPVNGLLMGPTIQAHVFAPVSLFPSDVTINWLSIQIFRFIGRCTSPGFQRSMVNEWSRQTTIMCKCDFFVKSKQYFNSSGKERWKILALVNKGIIL